MAEDEIWIFSEIKQLAFELLGGARELAESNNMSVSAIGIGEQELADEYLSYGADRVYLIPSKKSLPFEAYTSTMAELIQSQSPNILLMGATNRGKTLAALLAGVLNTGCSTDCRNIRFDDNGKLLVDRLGYGGAAVITETCVTSPFILTAPFRSFQALPKDNVRKGEVFEVSFKADQYAARIIEIQPKPKDELDLSAAGIVVGFGRGLSKKEDISIIETLAEAFDAVVGCSRPIAEDYRWMPKERQIGISGKPLKGKLYIVIGCSGQIQHMVAVEARVVLAINNDERAPVFEASDYGIVANLYDVVPALTEAVKKL